MHSHSILGVSTQIMARGVRNAGSSTTAVGLSAARPKHVLQTMQLHDLLTSELMYGENEQDSHVKAFWMRRIQLHD